MQAFYLDKALLVQAGQTAPPLPLTPEELAWVQRALEETEGRLSIPGLVAWGLSEWHSRKLLREWELRGWVRKDPYRDNAHYLTAKLRGLLINHRTPQTTTNPSNRISDTETLVEELPLNSFHRQG
ncbi:MAG: hypothetical protein JXA21_17745 [Anaerolineae bacterium]|nr:hypothetical protein [Anaerolineae bacterium]